MGEKAHSIFVKGTQKVGTSKLTTDWQETGERDTERSLTYIEN